MSAPAALLALASLGAWLAAFGCASLAHALDRLHCVTFLTVAAGVPILCAAALQGGAPDPVLKLALLLGAMLIGGAGIAHATARALTVRRRSR